ncbi:MAG: cell division protein ZapD [Sulfuricella sp.]|nr:cell division protein ZapD [Sulfuricella sp.]
MIIYDHPLNERIRTLLRLEDLYAKVQYYCALSHQMDHHAALLILFEILEVACRADLKSDLLQELERQKHILEALRNNPAISEDALNEVLRDIDNVSGHLHGTPGKVGQHLRDNEWLMGIKQRTGIPGGVCEFDLPSYHYWLNQDENLRRQNLIEWLMPMLPIRDGLKIVLRMLRDSGKFSRHTAVQGTFQQMLSGRVAQMLRVSVSRNSSCFPEISANKYAINIRFNALDSPQKPRGCETDVEFDLTLCNL